MVDSTPLRNGRQVLRAATSGLLTTALVAILTVTGCGDDDRSHSDPASPTPAATPTPSLSANPALTIGQEFERPARVVLPADYDVAKRYPLVILLHGFGANAGAQDLVFRLEVRTTAYQFILVLPEGTTNAQGQQFWDAMPECCNFGGFPVDDVGYLASLMQDALELYAVDPERIRLIGHSNGGYMSYRYACEQPVPVDRIVVLAGSTFIDPASCRNPRPVSVLHMHGTADDTILYAQNLPPDGDLSKVTTIGAEATVARWAGVAGCAAEPTLVERRDHQRGVFVAGAPEETDILRYHDCSRAERVELWRAIGGDHIYLRGNDDWRNEVAAFLAE